jgi:hypothetical protein
MKGLRRWKKEKMCWMGCESGGMMEVGGIYDEEGGDERRNWRMGLK